MRETKVLPRLCGHQCSRQGLCFSSKILIIKRNDPHKDEGIKRCSQRNTRFKAHGVCEFHVIKEWKANEIDAKFGDVLIENFTEVMKYTIHRFKMPVNSQQNK